MDVHVRRAVTEGLRLRGVDVLTAQEDGASLLKDPELLERAASLGRVFVFARRGFVTRGPATPTSGRALYRRRLRASAQHHCRRHSGLGDYCQIKQSC